MSRRKHLEQVTRLYTILDLEMQLLDIREEAGEEAWPAIGLPRPEPDFIFRIIAKAEDAYVRAGSPPLPLRDAVIARLDRFMPPSVHGSN